jgi:hypothetical protein
MLEIVNKKTGETIIFPTPDHSKGETKIDMLEFETCVMCGAVTDVPVNLHIDFRKTFVEGAGQLCGTCYDKIYNTKLP